MFKVIFTTAILGFMFMGTKAFAVEWSHCSNADGSLKSVGKGAMGVNVVEWFQDGEKIVDAKGFFNEAKNFILDKKETVDALDYIVATEVSVRFPAGHGQFRMTEITDFVICKQHFDERKQD